MKKLIPLIFIIISVLSCNSERDMMDSYVGSPKNKLVKEWGQPYKTTADTGKGESLIYLVHLTTAWKWQNDGYHAFNPNGKKHNDYYRIMYVHPDSTIYYWATIYADGGGIIEHAKRQAAKQ